MGQTNKFLVFNFKNRHFLIILVKKFDKINFFT